MLTLQRTKCGVLHRELIGLSDGGSARYHRLENELATGETSKMSLLISHPSLSCTAAEEPMEAMRVLCDQLEHILLQPWDQSVAPSTGDEDEGSRLDPETDFFLNVALSRLVRVLLYRRYSHLSHAARANQLLRRVLEVASLSSHSRGFRSSCR